MRWAIFSLVVSVVLMGSKWGVYALTSSSAVLSDAVESLINVLSSAFVLFAVWLAGQPRDDDHPYGHGRVEFFSAGFEGALISFAAISIIVMSIARFLDPVPLTNLGLGAVLQAVISVVTFGAGQLLILKGRRLNSPSLVADGLHIRADAITTVGTLIGVLAVWLTGLTWLDTLAALCVAAWLGWSGISVVRGAVGGLMDEADPAQLDKIAQVLEKVRDPGWIAPHHTKVHNLGNAIHIDLHMVFPNYWTLEHAHDASERVEEGLKEAFGPLTEVMLHMESCTTRSCSYCDMPDCPIRDASFVRRYPWTASHITSRQRPAPLSPAEASSTVQNKATS